MCSLFFVSESVNQHISPTAEISLEICIYIYIFLFKLEHENTYRKKKLPIVDGPLSSESPKQTWTITSFNPWSLVIFPLSAGGWNHRPFPKTLQALNLENRCSFAKQSCEVSLEVFWTRKNPAELNQILWGMRMPKRWWLYRYCYFF